MEISLRDEGPVALITWNDGENRVNLDSLALLNELFDDVEGRSGPLAIVLTGTGKFFSNGLDLDRFLSDVDEMGRTFTELKRTVGRILMLPAYSVAAVNGHAFAAGAAMSLGFDYRVMREDRGYWCMNEVQIGLPLDEGLFSVLRHRLPFATATQAALTGQRYGGPDARAAGIVEETASEADVLARALAIAERYATVDRSVLARHKYFAHGAEAAHLGARVRDL
ncbi:MAG TPA: enoyl-CoA hydratase/isomerase family protein [Acidimicrobiales bacterium]|nr:enoyl-CoA hydratase/isomerase family protein [Acidimicrobiales bacterium]